MLVTCVSHGSTLSGLTITSKIQSANHSLYSLRASKIQFLSNHQFDSNRSSTLASCALKAQHIYFSHRSHLVFAEFSGVTKCISTSQRLGCFACAHMVKLVIVVNGVMILRVGLGSHRYTALQCVRSYVISEEISFTSYCAHV